MQSKETFNDNIAQKEYNVTFVLQNVYQYFAYTHSVKVPNNPIHTV